MENRISTLATERKKTKLSSILKMDFQMQQKTVYRKLDLTSESREIALAQAPGLFSGWGVMASLDSAVYHPLSVY